MKVFWLGAVFALRLFGQCEPAHLLWIPSHADADPLYRFDQSGRTGFIDQQGHVVIAPRPDIQPNAEFRGGLVRLRGAEPQYITSQGVLATRLPAPAAPAAAPAGMHFTTSGACRPALDCELKLGCEFVLVNASGAPVAGATFQNAREFSEGLAAVERDNRWGFIDQTGNIVIPFRFASAYSFASGRARVRLTAEGSYGYIDSTGQFATAPWFPFAEDFVNGLALVGDEDDGFWYIDSEGTQAFPEHFLSATSFFKGLAHVQLFDPDSDSDQGLAYIDPHGRHVFTYHR